MVHIDWVKMDKSQRRFLLTCERRPRLSGSKWRNLYNQHISSYYEPRSSENLTYALGTEAVGKNKLRTRSLMENCLIASCSFEIFRCLTISIVQEKKGHFEAEMLIFQLSNLIIFFSC